MGRGINLSEREIGAIEVLNQEGKNISQIARAINRNRDVVRNFLKDPSNYGKRYKGKSH